MLKVIGALVIAALLAFGVLWTLEKITIRKSTKEEEDTL